MYADRIKRVKEFFAAHPAEAVPELQYLSEDDWLESVEYDHHRIDPDGLRQISALRSKAQIRFATDTFEDALRKYGKDNPGAFPTDFSQLTPYFKAPVDASLMQNWAILPTSSLPTGMRIDEGWVITQKAPVNAELDQRIVLGMKEVQLGHGSTNDWVLAP
jgi:hypothetical protein